MALKEEKDNIVVVADDNAVAADKLISMFEKTGMGEALPFKTVFNKEGGAYRVYMDDATDEDNSYGKVLSIKDDKGDELDLSKALKLATNITVGITSWDEDDEVFTGTLSVFKEEGIVDSKMDSIPTEIMKEINKKMSEGIKESNRFAVEDRVRYMLDNCVNLKDISDVIAYWDVDRINEWGMRIPTYYVDPELKTKVDAGKAGLISRAIQSYLIGAPKILKGPKSTGKNTCINTIVWLFGDKVEEHTFTQQDSLPDLISSESTDNSASQKLKAIDTSILSEANKIRMKHSSDATLPYTTDEDQILLADALFKQLSAEAASVHLIHEYRAFARWLLDTSGHTCFVADELNMADANLLVGLLHPILDGSITEYDIPGRGPVPLSNHLMMFATMNVGYAGEQEGNPATRSRLGAFELAQPASIIDLLHSGDLPEKYYVQAAKFYDECRNAVGGNSAGELTDQCLNIRGIVRALVHVKRFEGRAKLKQALEDEVVTACDDEERPVLMTILNRTVNI